MSNFGSRVQVESFTSRFGLGARCGKASAQNDMPSTTTHLQQRTARHLPDTNNQNCAPLCTLAATIHQSYLEPSVRIVRRK